MSIYLRKATLEDAEIILKWRNDSLTREYSFSKEVIDTESHFKWFKKRNSDRNCYIWILIADEERVGQIRVEAIDHVGEIHYVIAPEQRGKGYGKRILSLVEEKVSAEIKELCGIVKAENIASRRCFLTNGYEEMREDENIVFRKKLPL